MTSNSFASKVTVIESDITIDEAFRLLASNSRQVKCPGIIIFIFHNTFAGILTDGDFRKAYSEDIDFSLPITTILNTSPKTFNSSLPLDVLLKNINHQIQINTSSKLGWLKHIILVDSNNHFIDILNYFDLVRNEVTDKYISQVYGMGYVGLTLSVSLASLDDFVIGIDINSKVVENLSQGNSHIHEPGLTDKLRLHLNAGSILFADNDDTTPDPNVYIVCVGTPIVNNAPDLSALFSTLDSISKSLKVNDLVILRSTVPVGTTRTIVIPYLEKSSGLLAGTDFFVNFAPERTVEGNALVELQDLPQVIGGFSKMCISRGIKYWSRLCKSVSVAESLESAELVKLANNSFRDLSFAFANELSMICNEYNVNAHDLIKSANDGYPRNKIPYPSPGVGGYCLTKDPLLYNFSTSNKRSEITLNTIGRRINESASLYPLSHIHDFTNHFGITLSDIKVLIVGVAFKGHPETTDIRGSTAVDLFQHLQSLNINVSTYDSIISSDLLLANNLNPIKSLSLVDFDCILIMNNHRLNIDILHYLTPNKPRLIFDGWSQLNKSDILKYANHVYSTMGYSSLK